MQVGKSRRVEHGSSRSSWSLASPCQPRPAVRGSATTTARRPSPPGGGGGSAAPTAPATAAPTAPRPPTTAAWPPASTPAARPAARPPGHHRGHHRRHHRRRAPARCTPGTATSTGVSPTEVKVGNVSQLTGLVPGFAQTSVNGVKAYFTYINSKGGVCGRKLSLVQADDRFQAATNRSETEKLAGQVIAFAGSLSVVDDGGAPILEPKGVADVSVATTAAPHRGQEQLLARTRPTRPRASATARTRCCSYLKQTRGITQGGDLLPGRRHRREPVEAVRDRHAEGRDPGGRPLRGGARRPRTSGRRPPT